MNHSYRLLYRGVLVSCLVPFAFGQAVTQPAKNEEVIELSPFVVNADDEQGYRATSTLAGTRIKSELKDLGTSIQVLTKQFMEDLGVQDAQDLLLYTTNTEVGGVGGNFSGEDADSNNLTSSSSRNNPQGATRVRGLGNADLTRSYFKTVIPFDTYNVGTVSINRGSNSTLFGVGSPSGIIEQTPDAASWKDAGEIATRLDSEGSIRGSLNFNRVLIKNKLAIRAALLEDDRKYVQKQAFQDTKRVYAAFNWKITPTTALRGNWERGTVRANRPDSLGPLESLSPWLSYGRPIVDSSLATGIGRSLTAPTGMKVDKNGDGILDDIFPADLVAANTYVYAQNPDGSFRNAGAFTWNNTTKVASAANNIPTIPGAVSQQNFGIVSVLFNQILVPYGGNGPAQSAPGFVAQPPATQTVVGDGLSLMGDGQLVTTGFSGTPNLADFFDFYKTQGYTNTEGFDWRRNLLEGSTSSQKDGFSAYNVALEQTFWDRKVGVELAFDRQDFNRTSFTPLQGEDIQVDVQARLPNTTVNPNFGRPYVVGNTGRTNSITKLTTYRATAFMDHDFARQFADGWGKWLGRHTITGLYDRNERYVRNWGTSLVWEDPDTRRQLSIIDNPGVIGNNFIPIVYVGPSVLGSNTKTLADVIITPPTGLSLWNPGTTVPVTYWDPGTNPATGTLNVSPARTNQIKTDGKLVTRDAAIRERISTSINDNNTITKSQAGVWQSYFLKNHVVGTIGYRKDTVVDDVYQNPPVDDLGFITADSPVSEWGQLTRSTASASQWSYGVVAHVPDKWMPIPNTRLSVHYAQSSNFSLLPGRVDWNNIPIPNPSGDTVEKGFSVSTLNDRLSVRFNWFETSLQGRTSPSVSNLVFNLVYQSAANYAIAAHVTPDPVFKAFDLAVANLLLDSATPGENAIVNAQRVFNAAGELINVTRSGNTGASDTEDLISKGMEVELTFNPTKNWRIQVNVAQQEAIKSNVQPYSDSNLAYQIAMLDQPIPGFEWIKLGAAARGPQVNTAWTIDPVNKLYHNTSNPTGGFTTFNDFLDTRLVNYRTAKAGEGSKSPEQREWRVNIVNSYTFNQGRLKGLQVGGAYRWQDKVGIGFPLFNDPVTGLIVGDVANPVFAPAEDSVDLFTGYTLPWLRQYGRWSVRLQVSNVFAGTNDFIPVQVQPDGVTIARVRLAPQRLWNLTSTFKF